ncbi:MAG: hypothetical protein ACO37V_02105 [Ilumatobacteraceae bacterium]
MLLVVEVLEVPEEPPEDAVESLVDEGVDAGVDVVVDPESLFDEVVVELAGFLELPESVL